MSFIESPSCADRSKLYKNNSKSDDSRRRRTECSVELRRQKRNDEMMKRRNLTIEAAEDSDSSITSESQDAGVKIISTESMTVDTALSILTNNPGIEDLRRAFEGIRKMLSKSKDPPIDEVIKAGLVQALSQALLVEDEKVQFDAAWGLTNIVSGTPEQTMAVIQTGATKSLIVMCNSQSAKIAEQAIWAVANIAGDSTQLRDHVIEEGLVPTLKKLIKNIDELSVSFVRTVAWTYSNLVRHKNPQLPYDTLKDLAPGLSALLKYDDLNVKTDSGWALSYMTDGADQQIELAYNCGVIPDVLSFITAKQDSLTAPALRVLGNFATGNDSLTQVVVDSGVLLNVIPSLLKRSNVSIVKECCWLISNVVAGTESQIQYVLDAGLIPLMFDVLKAGDNRSRYEASWAIANISHGGNAKQILEMGTREGVESICGCLTVKNNELVSNMLESILAILKTLSNCDPENLEKIKLIVEECGGLDALEALQQHESQQIYDLAYKIVEDYFGDEEEENQDIEPYDQPLDLAASNPFNF